MSAATVTPDDIRLKTTANYDVVWRGGIIGDGVRGYAITLADGDDSWHWLRIEDHGPEVGWVVIFEGETITPDATRPWHTRKNGTPSKDGAQSFAETLIGVT